MDEMYNNENKGNKNMVSIFIYNNESNEESIE